MPQKAPFPSNTPSSVYTVEQCYDCPTGLTGHFCDQISQGYYRSTLHPMNSTIIQCSCNNRSDTCDSLTGTCTNCTGNTTGDSCEQCSIGYYNSNLSGNLNCQSCMCPGPNISHSSFCALDGSGDLVCGNCSVGYTGDRCQRCDDGYYGNATVSISALCVKYLSYIIYLTIILFI